MCRISTSHLRLGPNVPDVSFRFRIYLVFSHLGLDFSEIRILFLATILLSIDSTRIFPLTQIWICDEGVSGFPGIRVLEEQGQTETL